MTETPQDARCCPGHGTMAHARGCVNHPESPQDAREVERRDELAAHVETIKYLERTVEIMRREKEHGWAEAERWEGKAEKSEAQRDEAVTSRNAAAMEALYWRNAAIERGNERDALQRDLAQAVQRLGAVLHQVEVWMGYAPLAHQAFTIREIAETGRAPVRSNPHPSPLDLAQAVASWRKVTSAMGYGDGVTEPQATPDEFITAMRVRDAEASEWRESQRWRDDCALAGHPQDEDCWEHDPSLRLAQAVGERDRLRAGIERLADDYAELRTRCPDDPMGRTSASELRASERDLRALLTTPDADAQDEGVVR